MVTLDAGDCSRQNATLIDAAGDGDGLGLKEKQPDLRREAERRLRPLAATQRPEATVLERDHGPWGRRSRWRTHACAGGWDWTHRRQAWVVRTAKFTRQTTPRADSEPVAVEEHDSMTNLAWHRLDGIGVLGVVRGHWGIENNGFRTLEMDGQEERAWWTKGAATEVLGWHRRWAYHVVGLLKGRDLRARRSRALTLERVVIWIARVSAWQEARRRIRLAVPTGENQELVGRGGGREAPRSDVLNHPPEGKSVPESRGTFPKMVSCQAPPPLAILWEGLVVLFGALTGDWHLVHTDAEFAKRTVFGERIAHGLSILAIGGGLMLRAGDHPVPSSMIILYELDKVRFVVLTKISDTIHVETEVVQVGALDEQRDLITVSHRRVSQRGEELLSYTSKLVVSRRPAVRRATDG